MSVALTGQSSGGNYLFLTESYHNFADAPQPPRLPEGSGRRGGPVTYATAQQITQRAKRPQHASFHFSAHLVPQQRDDGDLIILPRRLYRNGRTNSFYNDRTYGGQWGHADSYAYHRIQTLSPVTVRSLWRDRARGERSVGTLDSTRASSAIRGSHGAGVGIAVRPRGSLRRWCGR